MSADETEKHGPNRCRDALARDVTRPIDATGTRRENARRESHYLSAGIGTRPSRRPSNE